MQTNTKTIKSPLFNFCIKLELADTLIKYLKGSIVKGTKLIICPKSDSVLSKYNIFLIREVFDVQVYLIALTTSKNTN